MQENNNSIPEPINNDGKDNNTSLEQGTTATDNNQPDNEQEQAKKAATKRKRKKARIIVLVVLVLAVIAYFAIPAVNSKINQIFMIFSSASVETIMGYIRSFGVWAVLVSFY